MALQVCILGIDGSGKSSLVAALAPIVAGECGTCAGSVGDTFSIADAEQDHLAAHFAPDGLPWVARLARWLKRMAKRWVDHPRLYPVFKLGHTLAQDAAARCVGRRERVQVMFSDGNTLLSSLGRAANYLRPASDERSREKPVPTTQDRRAVLSYLLEGTPLPSASQERLPDLTVARRLQRVLSCFGLGAHLPDVVIFLDLPPALALERIRGRGKRVDRHENEADLSQARQAYLDSLAAFSAYRPTAEVLKIPVAGLALGETLRRVVEVLRPRLAALKGELQQSSPEPLGTSRQTRGAALWLKVLSPRYVFRYLLAHWLHGSWRELTFLVSKLGRIFLKQGYSADVMRLIYDTPRQRSNWLDRVFLDYSLHRAVYDRLELLVGQVQPELERRLAAGEPIRIFTAPSGFAYDVFRPLEAIATAAGGLQGKAVEVVAADLDPQGTVELSLRERAAHIGVRLTFLRGDLTRPETLATLSQLGPYDLVLFVGLSSWLPKTMTLAHLRWLKANLQPGGRLVTDCFSADSYALSGRYVGYKAHYYSADVYRALVDYCGFDGMGAHVESGRDGINHTLIAAAR